MTMVPEETPTPGRVHHPYCGYRVSSRQQALSAVHSIPTLHGSDTGGLFLLPQNRLHSRSLTAAKEAQGRLQHKAQLEIGRCVRNQHLRRILRRKHFLRKPACKSGGDI